MENKLTIDSEVYKIGYSKCPIGYIQIQGYNDKRWKFVPQPDITTYELSLLMVMFAYVTAPQSYLIHDYWSYVTKHKLERHFEEIEFGG